MRKNIFAVKNIHWMTYGANSFCFSMWHMFSTDTYSHLFIKICSLHFYKMALIIAF